MKKKHCYHKSAFLQLMLSNMRSTTRPFALKSHPAHLQHSKTLEKQENKV